MAVMRRVALGHFLRTAAGKAILALRERRLPGSPKRWLRDLRLHYEELRGEDIPAGSAAIIPRPFASDLVKAREALGRVASKELAVFLASGGRLELTPREPPRVSVVLVLHNRAELTLRCLRSLAAQATVSFEVIVVDNASTDRTRDLIERLVGARVLVNPVNQGFLLAVNLAARVAQGELLLLLNNDAELMPGSLDAAVSVLRAMPDVGAVGGKLVLPDGRLQEAGSIIWRDGSCQGYARGEAPLAPETMFRRDVDFCSGAFLLTRRDLFVELGGFDERFQPAYYEDADYCVRAWQAGKRVVYEPRAVALHVEFASTRVASRALDLQAARRLIFRHKHAAWLDREHRARAAGVLAARIRPPTRRRVLVVDDRAPRGAEGAGFPRAVALVRALHAGGDAVTLYPTCATKDDWGTAYQEVPAEVEIMLGLGRERLRPFLVERAGHYHRVIVSRPDNMRLLASSIDRGRCAGAPLVYDAEALFAARDAQRRRLSGEPVAPAEEARDLADEMTIARRATAVIVASSLERDQFVAAGCPHVVTVGHALAPTPTPRLFDQRAGVLFVGAFAGLHHPNSDAVIWFLREVWPTMQRDLGDVASFRVVGARVPDEIVNLQESIAGVELLGRVADLVPIYDRARLFVAPTRYAAGIPFKVHHAAAHGVPVVCTSLLARQLGWHDGHDLLVADTPVELARQCLRLYRDRTLWEDIRRNALARVERDCSPTTFAAALEAVLRVAPAHGSSVEGAA